MLLKAFISYNEYIIYVLQIKSILNVVHWLSAQTSSEKELRYECGMSFIHAYYNHYYLP